MECEQENIGFIRRGSLSELMGFRRMRDVEKDSDVVSWGYTLCVIQRLDESRSFDSEQVTKNVQMIDYEDSVAHN